MKVLILVASIVLFAVVAPIGFANMDDCSRQIVDDTCIIEGMVFKFVPQNSPQKLDATIKKGHIKVKTGKYRVIRYVFSLSPDEHRASVVRHFGDLVSYPVILDLKESKKGDRYYFENIVIANSVKQILNNEVKPIVIERVK